MEYKPDFTHAWTFVAMNDPVHIATCTQLSCDCRAEKLPLHNMPTIETAKQPRGPAPDLTGVDINKLLKFWNPSLDNLNDKKKQLKEIQDRFRRHKGSSTLTTPNWFQLAKDIHGKIKGWKMEENRLMTFQHFIDSIGERNVLVIVCKASEIQLPGFEQIKPNVYLFYRIKVKIDENLVVQHWDTLFKTASEDTIGDLSTNFLVVLDGTPSEVVKACKSGE